MKVKALRAFCIGGARVEPGQEAEMPDHIAIEAIWLGKAERVKAPSAEPPKAQPMTTKTAASLVAKKSGD